MKLTEINIRDPFVLLHNDKYYMYGSRVGEQRGFDVYISDDLENWSEPKIVFEAYDGFWGTTNFWAPEVHMYKGRFYMLASFKADDMCRGTGILVSDAPDGKFTVHSERITPPQWECLDGTLYIENDVPYMVFCREWLQVNNGEIYAVKLSEDLSKTDGEPFLLWRAGDASWVSPLDNEGTKFVTDGPFLYKTKDGKLKSLWSSFSNNEYVLATSTSENGSITGKWRVDEKLLYERDGGHGMIFRTKEGINMVAIHAPNTSFDERPRFLEFTE